MWRKVSAGEKEQVVEISLRAHADSYHTSFVFKGESPLSFPPSQFPSSQPEKGDGLSCCSRNNKDRWNAADIVLDDTVSSLSRARAL